jgi:thioredoxin-related protein
MVRKDLGRDLGKYPGLAALVAVILVAFLSPPFGTARAAGATPGLNDDGLYEEPWFLQSFLDLREDLADASAQGKRFAIIWELKGCPYCRETHLVNFADPDIADYVRGNFAVLQLNRLGAREVTDFDGEVLEERELARKHGIAFTPTVQFFPEAVPEEVANDKLEIARMPGYFKPPHFLAMFRFVREKGYENMGFRDFLKLELQ